MSEDHSHIGANSSFSIFLVLVLFFLSGVAALLYQVIWQRMLGFFAGTDIYSATITISAFMGGLGCGNMVGGAIADRLSQRKLVMVFALSEATIALFGLASKWFYYDYLYLSLPQLGNHFVILAATLFSSLLIPTFVMGMSLPLLSKAFTQRIGSASTVIGRLYGLNTLGAAAGALITSFLFIRYFGFTTSLWFGAGLNIVCAAGAMAIIPFLGDSRVRHGQENDAYPGAEGGPSDRPHFFSLSTWCLIYTCSGFIALSMEIIWFRLIGVILKGSSFTFSILLGAFLSGLAVGTVVGIWWANRDRRFVLNFFVLQAGVIVYAVLSITVFAHYVEHIPFLSYLWTYLGADLNVSSVRWDYVTMIHFLIPMILIAPSTFMMGMSFPFLQKIIQTDMNFVGRRVGWLQTSNIIGSMSGAVVTGLIFLEFFGVSVTLKLMVVMGGLFILLAVYRGARGRSTIQKVLASSTVPAVCLTIVLVVPSNATIWAKFHGTEIDEFIYAEGRSGVTLIRKEEKRFPFLVLSNGKGMSWIPYGGIHTALGALPVLMHPDPKQVAVIGLGSGDTAFAAGGRKSTEEIVCIEIVESQFKALQQFQRKWGYEALNSLLTDQRYEYVFTDGRAFVMRSQKTYDIIEIDAHDPHSAFSGSLYSYEFYDLLRRRLKPGGYAVTYWATDRNRNAFFRAFPHVLHLRGVLIGSERPIEFDRDEIYNRMMDPVIQKYYSGAGINLYKLLFPVFNDNPEIFAYSNTPLGDYNSDLFPKDEYMTPNGPL
ncbi:MAG: fused MFS/spermidine synthase [Thermodesulfobacteriota bacterium]